MHKFFAKTQFIGKNVIYLPQCHSTNTEMQTFLKKTILEEGTVVMADFQIKGRGQLNGRWISQKEKNILMSVLLNPTFLSLHQQYYLTIIQGLAITDALGHFIANDVKIKWPNDIYVGANKIAGILIEASVSKKSIRSRDHRGRYQYQSAGIWNLESYIGFIGNRPIPKQRSRNGAHFIIYGEVVSKA